MIKPFYVYELDAFAYSDFETHVLIHEKKFNKTEFRKMIEISRQKAKKKYKSYKGKWVSRMEYYPTDLIRILIEDYGFKKPEILIADVGCHYDDIIHFYKSDENGVELID